MCSCWCEIVLGVCESCPVRFLLLRFLPDAAVVGLFSNVNKSGAGADGTMEHVYRTRFGRVGLRSTFSFPLQRDNV